MDQCENRNIHGTDCRYSLPRSTRPLSAWEKATKALNHCGKDVKDFRLVSREYCQEIENLPLSIFTEDAKSGVMITMSRFVPESDKPRNVPNGCIWK